MILTYKSWGDCVEVAMHIINVVPSVVLGNKSPYEMLYGRTPLLDYFRVINVYAM